MDTLKRLRRALSHLPISHLLRGGTAEVPRGVHWPEIFPTGKNEIKVSTGLSQNTEGISMAKLDGEGERVHNNQHVFLSQFRSC